jgi:hypothetical protein
MAAASTIEETIIRLPVEDQIAFSQAILKPPPMERAIERYLRDTTRSQSSKPSAA